MKDILSGFQVYIFEFKANRLRPAIIKHLNDQKSYWQETLDKFRRNDKITTVVFHNEEEILNNITNIETDLSIENKYQLLKLAYRNDKEMLLSITTDYYTFWACLEFFRKSNNVNAAEPFYAKIALEFGHKKQHVYTRFVNLLGT